jgi:hypothetical protein
LCTAAISRRALFYSFDNYAASFSIKKNITGIKFSCAHNCSVSYMLEGMKNSRHRYLIVPLPLASQPLLRKACFQVASQADEFSPILSLVPARH